MLHALLLICLSFHQWYFMTLTDWQPVQAVRCLSPCDSWDELKPPPLLQSWVGLVVKKKDVKMAGWFIILEFDMCGSVQGMCRTHMCLQVWMIEVACVCLPICEFMESGWISELQHSSSSSSKGLKRRRMIKCHECPCLLFCRGESSESFPFWIIPHHTHAYSLSARTTVPCRFKNRKKANICYVG